MLTTIVTVEIYYQYNKHGDVIRVSDRTGTLLNEYDKISKGVDFVLARKSTRLLMPSRQQSVCT